MYTTFYSILFTTLHTVPNTKLCTDARVAGWDGLITKEQISCFLQYMFTEYITLKGYQARAKRRGPKGPRAHARALAKFTPVHHWEGVELKLGRKRCFWGKFISGRFYMTLEQNN